MADGRRLTTDRRRPLEPSTRVETPRLAGQTRLKPVAVAAETRLNAFSIAAGGFQPLARGFGMSVEFWTGIQIHYEVEKAKMALADRLEKEVKVLAHSPSPG